MIHTLLQADMAGTINVFAELVKQSPLIMALLIAIKYFYRKQIEQDVCLKEASEKLEKYIADDRQNLLRVVENNTQVMQRFSEHMEKLEKEIKQ